VLFDVWLVSRAVTGLLDRALEPSGLSADEFGVYSVLTSSDSMTPGELARWMSAPPHRVELREAHRGAGAPAARAQPGRRALLRAAAHARRAGRAPAGRSGVRARARAGGGRSRRKDAAVRAALRRLHAAAEASDP